MGISDTSGGSGNVVNLPGRAAKLSVAIPCFNEEAGLAELHRRVTAVCRAAVDDDYEVILVNDDYTPREFVVSILKAEFRMNEEQAYRVMLTAHQRGVCVVAVYAKDVAETKATRSVTDPPTRDSPASRLASGTIRTVMSRRLVPMGQIYPALNGRQSAVPAY